MPQVTGATAQLPYVQHACEVLVAGELKSTTLEFSSNFSVADGGSCSGAASPFNRDHDVSQSVRTSETSIGMGELESRAVRVRCMLSEAEGIWMWRALLAARW